MLSNVFAFLLARCCTHQQRAFPMHNEQRCLTCGSIRTYIIGQTPGPWHAEALTEKEIA